MEVSIVVLGVVSAAVGAAAYLFGKRSAGAELARSEKDLVAKDGEILAAQVKIDSLEQQVQEQKEATQRQLAMAQEVAQKQLDDMKMSLKENYERQLAAANEAAAKQLAAANEAAAKQLAAVKEASQQQLAAAKDTNEKQIEALKQMNREQIENQLKLIQEQMQTTSEKVLKARQEELGAVNKEQMSKIIDPLNLSFKQIKDQMAKMEESVQKVNTDSAERKVSITQTIEALAKETIRVGAQAEDLAKALKNKSKVQGDWGEQVLENILEGSGLRKGEDYVTQYNVKGEENENFRPDVIVKCPGEKQIVIDSKVSLTAYLDYVAAEDPDSQKKYAAENLSSIKKHIDELSAKNYEKLVGNTISHVLMFIPNEGSYILALQTDPKIGQYAFAKNVLLINPTNLMMSLKLIYNIWQSERQTRNVETIVAESTGLYEKFAGFLDSFNDIGSRIESLQKAFGTAENQLCSGRGNLIKRVESLKDKGILPKKSIPDKYLDQARD